MIDVSGEYGSARIFADTIDKNTISQINTMLCQKAIKDLKIRIMPDCHAGKGCVVGTTMKLLNKVEHLTKYNPVSFFLLKENEYIYLALLKIYTIKRNIMILI